MKIKSTKEQVSAVEQEGEMLERKGQGLAKDLDRLEDDLDTTQRKAAQGCVQLGVDEMRV